MNTPIRPRGLVSKQPTTSDDVAAASLDDADPSPQSGDAAPEAGTTEDATDTAQKLSPLERWKKNLKAAELSEDRANAILDAIISKGYYEQDYKLLHGRLRVRFRTRSASTLRRVGDALDQVNTNDPRVHNQVMGRLLLIDSLAGYNRTTFVFPPVSAPMDEQQMALKARADVVDALPAMVYEALMATLSRFDIQVAAACSEGDVEGF